MDKIKIGTFQGEIKENDFSHNLKRVYEVIDSVKAENLDFLCFPETFLSGYAKESVKESCVSIDDERIKKLIEDTAHLDTVFLVGFAEKRKDGIYNSQLVFYKGENLGVQTKTMLTRGYDDKIFKTDLNLNVFKAKGIKFGIAICHTTSFIEPALYLRVKGARLLFTPHFNDIVSSIKDDNGKTFGYWPHRQMVLNNQAGLATLLKMVVVRSNIIRVEGKHLGSGDSNIWDMDGNLVASGTPFFEEVVTCEFDKKIFTEEHWIDRREVPYELYEMIQKAAKEKKES